MNLYGRRILVIEDDEHVHALIKAMLKTYNVELDLQKDGLKGLESALKNNYDLILLDIMLPGMDGWEVCRELKNHGVESPIIMLTAKAEETDKVLGLELGADDFVTKPFSPRELTARMKAVIRRFEKTTDGSREKLYFPEIALEIDNRGYTVQIDKERINLAPKEFDLLALLASNPGQVFSRDDLLDQIWGYENHKDTRTVDEHIKRLRKNFHQAGIINDPLVTIWGKGYKFEIGG